MVQCFIKPKVLGIVLYWLSGIDGKTLQFTFNSHLKVMSVHPFTIILHILLVLVLYANVIPFINVCIFQY